MTVPARCVGHPQAWRPADWGAERGYRLPPSVTAVKPLTVAQPTQKGGATGEGCQSRH